ncbi:MAG: alpha/beta hydrolase [bacterium]|nr:alpha/beta hydrolase [bacterium]
MILTEEEIEIDGISYRYLHGGKSGGIPILFLHGWGSKAESYRKASTFFPDDFPEIVIPNLPGFGFAPVPSTIWGIKEYTDWVNKLIQKLGWSKLFLAGHSFGGRLTIYIASHQPELLSGIILYATAGTTRRNQKRLSFFNIIAKLGKAILSLPGLHFIYPIAEKTLYKLVGNTDYLYAGEKREIFKKVINEDLSGLVKDIFVPTKLLWGKDDFQTPLADAEYIHQNIKGSELKVISGEGHIMHSRNPELFAKEFSELVAKLLSETSHGK